jgi:hypothetical protein
VVQKEKNPKKVRFELRNKEEDDSHESTKSYEEVEQLTSIVGLNE